MLVTAALVTLILGLPGGEFDDPFKDCDFVYNVTLGQTYDVYTPGYHDNSTYPAGTNCRWRAKCPADHNCQLVCNDMALPKSDSCTMDRLVIDRYNDSDAHSGESFCGKGTFTTKSVDRVMKIVLVTSSQSPGGKFFCQLTAVPKSASINCTCGYKKRIHTRIVDGEVAEANEFPMIAALTHLRTYNFVLCGATIIHARYLLTAAHCIEDKYIDNLAVIVGKHAKRKANKFSRTYKVVAIALHPKYNGKNGAYDAALLKTGSKIHFTDQIGPACLPFKFKELNMTGLKLTVIGWGDLSYGGAHAKFLMKVDLDVISEKMCRQTYHNLASSQFCTYTPGKGSCQGDSGGPVLYTDPSTGALFHLGITSYGENCSLQGQPIVNTEVTQLLDWIAHNMKDSDEEFCKM